MSGPLEVGDLSPRKYFFAIAVALGLIFALIDDGGGRSLPVNLLLWQLQSCIPMALLLAAHLSLSRLRSFEHRGPWTQLLLSGLAGSALFAAPALLLDVAWFGDGSEVFTAGELLNEFLNMAPPVTLTWIAINAPFVLGLRLRAQGSEASLPAQGDGSEASGKATGFMGLLPRELRGPVLYLQAELHYLAVVTERGRGLVLYNLRDAIFELADTPGLQTHRSFWVAIAAVESFRRDGRQGRLLLSNGDAVPVSRRRLGEVEKVFSSGT